MSADVDRLKLAFGVSIGRAIIDADRKVDYGEFRLFGRIFPRVMLRELGFIDDKDQFTEDLAGAWLEACEVLPKAMSNDDKLDMLALFYGTSMADGELDDREMAVVTEASNILGIDAETLEAHLQTL